MKRVKKSEPIIALKIEALIRKRIQDLCIEKGFKPKENKDHEDVVEVITGSFIGNLKERLENIKSPKICEIRNGIKNLTPKLLDHIEFHIETYNEIEMYQPSC